MKLVPHFPMKLILRIVAPALAAVAVACSSAQPERASEPSGPAEAEAAPELPPGASPLPEADAPPSAGGFVADPSLRTQRAGDEGVLVGPDGRGLAELPPEVLADVRAQLLAAGAKDAVAQIDRRYDLATGRARDAAHARGVRLAGAEVTP